MANTDTDWTLQESPPIWIDGTPEQVAEFWRRIDESNAYWRARMEADMARCLFADWKEN